MSFAFLPLYTGDYLRDTQHLSCTEHGIYLKLLIYCWDQQGPVPLDERKQMGIVNARSTEDIEALRRVLAEFFVSMIDGWYNRRMQRELERAAVLSNKRKAAGAKGFQAIARQLPGKSRARASTLTPTPTPTLTPISSKSKALDLNHLTGNEPPPRTDPKRQKHGDNSNSKPLQKALALAQREIEKSKTRKP